MKRGLYLLVVLLNTVSALAHGSAPVKTAAELIESSAIQVVGIAALIATVCIIYALMHKKLSPTAKKILFLSITIPVIIASMYAAGSTIYLNVISETKGPVHWHADFELWSCGTEVNLLDPTGLSNRIGSTTIHEHNDNRMHIEGVLVDTQEASLDNFFHLLGGELTENSLTIPTNNGVKTLKTGDKCNGESAELQVFAYRITNPSPSKNSGFTFTQTKLENPSNYVLAPYINIPPGDCIIIELDIAKDRTEKICETYRIAESKGDISGN